MYVLVLVPEDTVVSQGSYCDKIQLPSIHVFRWKEGEELRKESGASGEWQWGAGSQGAWMVGWSPCNPGPMLLDLVCHFVHVLVASSSSFFFFNGCTLGIWKFPGQGFYPSCSCNLYHSYGNTWSLTHCTGQETEPLPPQWPKLLPLDSSSPVSQQELLGTLFLKYITIWRKVEDQLILI